MLHGDFAGYWGVPTSSVDWCEHNYTVTPYVAELFNTTSSLAMVLVGVLGLLLHRGVLEARYLWAFAMVALVGVGSIAFHGTLRFELQMLDELPMLYVVILLVYLLVERGPTPRLGRWFPAVLVAHAVLVTGLCVFTRGVTQARVFLLSFTSLELYILWSIWKLQRTARSPQVRKLWRQGMGAYALAMAVWLVDRQACGFVSGTLPFNPQLHAWWHVLVSIGFYGLLLVVAHERLETLGRQPVLGRGLLPRLRARVTPQRVRA